MKIFKLVQAGTSFTLMFCLSAGSNSNVTKQDFFSSSDGVRFVSRREKNASSIASQSLLSSVPTQQKTCLF